LDEDGKRIEVEGLYQAYGDRQALADVTFSVAPREIVGFLGPNGGGKTTLFSILSTLIPVVDGTVRLLGYNLPREARAVRKYLGVVFQRPSLDGKLTVAENLRHHGHLYGLSGSSLTRRIREALEQLELADRSTDMVEILSGGLQRRAELAKAILHDPRLLLLDEPSTGLDVGVRRNVWEHVERLRQTKGVTVVLTTHIVDEAEMCDRVGVLDEGKLVVLDTPDALKKSMGGDVVTIYAFTPEKLRAKIYKQFGYNPVVVGRVLRVECYKGHEFVRDVVAAFPAEIRSVRFGKPTLEDVFVKLTGHSFKQEDT